MWGRARPAADKTVSMSGLTRPTPGAPSGSASIGAVAAIGPATWCNSWWISTARATPRSGDAFAAGVSMVAWIKAGLPEAWFLGPSPIGQIQKLGGVAAAACETKPADPVAELAGLLRRHPVSVHLAADCQRVCIREDLSWAKQNWATSKKISALVFTPAVLDYLRALGVEIVNGKNISNEGRKRNADK